MCKFPARAVCYLIGRLSFCTLPWDSWPASTSSPTSSGCEIQSATTELWTAEEKAAWNNICNAEIVSSTQQGRELPVRGSFIRSKLLGYTVGLASFAICC